jgi:hypothetical protein
MNPTIKARIAARDDQTNVVRISVAARGSGVLLAAISGTIEECSNTSIGKRKNIESTTVAEYSP